MLLEDPTITAADEIEIEPALEILSVDEVIEATGPGPSAISGANICAAPPIAAEWRP